MAPGTRLFRTSVLTASTSSFSRSAALVAQFIDARLQTRKIAPRACSVSSFDAMAHAGSPAMVFAHGFRFAGCLVNGSLTFRSSPIPYFSHIVSLNAITWPSCRMMITMRVLESVP
jgi:hypothetical protein